MTHMESQRSRPSDLICEICVICGSISSHDPMPFHVGQFELKPLIYVHLRDLWAFLCCQEITRIGPAWARPTVQGVANRRSGFALLRRDKWTPMNADACRTESFGRHSLAAWLSGQNGECPRPNDQSMTKPEARTPTAGGDIGHWSFGLHWSLGLRHGSFRPRTASYARLLFSPCAPCLSGESSVSRAVFAAVEGSWRSQQRWMRCFIHR